MFRPAPPPPPPRAAHHQLSPRPRSFATFETPLHLGAGIQPVILALDPPLTETEARLQTARTGPFQVGGISDRGLPGKRTFAPGSTLPACAAQPELSMLPSSVCSDHEGHRSQIHDACPRSLRHPTSSHRLNPPWQTSPISAYEIFEATQHVFFIPVPAPRRSALPADVQPPYPGLCRSRELTISLPRPARAPSCPCPLQQPQHRACPDRAIEQHLADDSATQTF